MKISTKKVERDIPSISKPSNTTCVSCQKDKQTRSLFKEKEYYNSQPLELVHINLCGPMRVQSINCNKYFILSIDDYSIMTSVQFLKHKSEIFDMFKVFKNQVENQIGRIIKCIRSDGGGDFISDEFIEYYEKYDIRKKISMARTPQ